MVTISKISWISKTSLEAEVTVTDGLYEVICFSQPCHEELNKEVHDPIYCLNSRSILKAQQNEYCVEKLKEPFAYYMTGQLINKKSSLVKIGVILVQLEDGVLPGDIEANDYICFYTQRIDIY